MTNNDTLAMGDALQSSYIFVTLDSSDMRRLHNFFGLRSGGVMDSGGAMDPLLERNFLFKSRSRGHLRSRMLDVHASPQECEQQRPRQLSHDGLPSG